MKPESSLFIVEVESENIKYHKSVPILSIKDFFSKFEYGNCGFGHIY